MTNSFHLANAKTCPVKERPILFTAPMVRALLDGSKTQTRRVARLTDAAHVKEPRGHRRWHPGDPEARLASPYGQPGDQLWVRETWQGPLLEEFESDADSEWMCAGRIHQYQNPAHCQYAADGGPRPEYIDAEDNLRQGWKPGIHMFRWASRISLEITSVRVERLKDISEEDAKAEGCEQRNNPDDDAYVAAATYRQGYRQLWDQINGEGSWDLNPWVWVVEFRTAATGQDQAKGGTL